MSVGLGSFSRFLGNDGLYIGFYTSDYSKKAQKHKKSINFSNQLTPTRKSFTLLLYYDFDKIKRLPELHKFYDVAFHF